jgi:fermentation-respiration switch protein FrsA (DUF1100 family)
MVPASIRTRRAGSPLFTARRRPGPLLLMHSSADTVVPIAQSHALLRIDPGAQLQTLRGEHMTDCTARPRALAWLGRLRRRRGPTTRGPRPYTGPTRWRSCPAP